MRGEDRLYDLLCSASAGRPDPRCPARRTQISNADNAVGSVRDAAQHDPVFAFDPQVEHFGHSGHVRNTQASTSLALVDNGTLEAKPVFTDDCRLFAYLAPAEASAHF
ncbi:MAG: hypothetical protein CTY20_03700 [Hyphomicrobium sp.]|nr:MAG: hypothetical protein CTY20_03700 [Hyphomicrobium sp.]